MWTEPAHGQESSKENGCAVLCVPELKFEPALEAEPLSEPARIAQLRNGQPVDTTQGSLETTLEVTFAMDVPTAWERVELGLDVSWTPFVETDENPFNGHTGSVTENPVELAAELSVTALKEETTGGWVGIEVAVADELGPAERPNADRWYTHKLALALDVAVLPFQRLDKAGYLQGIELEGSIDYAATGIPQAGDRFPDERFLGDASPWGASVAVVFPLAPLSP